MQALSCHTCVSQGVGVPAGQGLPPRQHLLSTASQVSPAPHRNPAQLVVVVCCLCRVGCFIKQVQVFIWLLFCSLSKNSSGGGGEG